jgi:hypothetical protein
MKITFSKLLTFAKALLFHIGCGMPKSSQSLIDYRWNVCYDCDYLYEKKQCLHCGCNVSNKKIFLNKLAWKDQKCPIEKW